MPKLAKIMRREKKKGKKKEEEKNSEIKCYLKSVPTACSLPHLILVLNFNTAEPPFKLRRKKEIVLNPKGWDRMVI